MNTTKYEYYKSQEVETFMMNILEKTDKVKPVFDLGIGYRYLDVEKSVNMNVGETTDFLERLVKAEILDREMYDMELRCPHCNSPNISVNYVCPKCVSTNIKKTILLEHNPCGYLGTVVTFGEPMICPKCGTPIKEGQYRDAGSIYKCGTCDHQIETPFIDHWCRVCDERFSFENALYEPKYAYLPSKSTKMDMTQGILYPSSIIGLFEEQGFSRRMESKIIGESGEEHFFDLAFKGYEQGGEKSEIKEAEFFVDIHFSSNPMGELDFLKSCGKVTDAKAALGNVDIILIILPGLDHNAEALLKTYDLNIITGENPSIALSRLKAALEKKVTTLKALSKLDTEMKAQSGRGELETKKKQRRSLRNLRL
ncbi:hypothetical protein MUP77_14035 [Candidatus Bathyarchaeota archaeon]|nr:hypothetical protein [Candidatus Bathyarchaeota archaeon]